MGRVIAVLLFLVLIAERPATQQLGLVSMLELWVKASLEHRPGARDDQVGAIGRWTRTEFESVVPYIEGLLALRNDPTSRALGRRQHRFAESEVTAMRRLVDPLQGEQAGNDFFRRAAMLHADIAMLADPASDQIPPSARNAPATRDVGSMHERLVVLAPDARFNGISYAALHWDLARRLLDEISPAPAADPIVVQWYRATAAYFDALSNRGESLPHLEHARKVLPRSAHIWYTNGCLQEAFASPSVQHVVRAVALPQGMTFEVPSARASRRAAEAYFRRALDLDPSLHEARVRLGWVLAGAERYDEALVELRRAFNATQDPVTRYYAALFIGHVEELEGREAAALASYEQAAALFPRAQSVRLAISHVTRADPDRKAALASLLDLLSSSPDSRATADPWEGYHRCEGRSKDALLAELGTQIMRGHAK